MKLNHFKFQLSRKQSVPKYLDEGDFVSFDFRTCEGNIGKLYPVCIIQDDVLADVAVLAAKGPFFLGQALHTHQHIRILYIIMRILEPFESP